MSRYIWIKRLYQQQLVRSRIVWQIVSEVGLNILTDDFTLIVAGWSNNAMKRNIGLGFRFILFSHSVNHDINFVISPDNKQV